MGNRVGENVDDDHSGYDQSQPDDGSQVEMLLENEKADKRDKNDTHSRPDGGRLMASPCILYLLFRFIFPALYVSERDMILIKKKITIKKVYFNAK